MHPEAERTVTYRRVLPRDLFNEAKLLKCAGKLVLAIEDGYVTNVTYEHDTTFTQNFIVGQDQSDGSVYLHNLKFYLCGVELGFSVPQDKTQSWNAYVDSFPLGFESLPVFDEHGKLTTEFRLACERER